MMGQQWLSRRVGSHQGEFCSYKCLLLPSHFCWLKARKSTLMKKKNGENERKGRELESYGARSSGVAVWCDQSRQREKRDLKKTYYCKLYERI